MKRKNKKVIFLSSLLGCSTLIASGLIVSSCSTKINTQDLNKTNPIIANPTTSLSENQNISDGINLNSSITTNDLTENKDTNSESSITSAQDSSDKLSTTQNNNKNDSTLPLSKNDSILKQIETCEDPLKFKIGWYTSLGNTFTINLKSIKGDSSFQNGNNNPNWIPNLRLFAVNLPYTLEFLGKNPQNVTIPNSNPYYPGIITTSQGKYRANYDYENIKLNYIYNSSNPNVGYFDGANYGHHLYSKYGFRFNRNYNNNDSEVTFNINLPPVFNPEATKENNISVAKQNQCIKGPTFYTSGYIFVMKWWTGQLSTEDGGAEALETKLEKALKTYFSKLFNNNSVNKQNSSLPLLSSFFIKHNNGDATNDPINHWHYDGHGYYGQWIADSIYREELKKTKIN